MIQNGAQLNLTISALGINGEGVAKHDGFTIFVDGALPNEEVVASIAVIKQNYAKGSLMRITKADFHRITPACSRYADCGGCHIMHLAYEAQLARKTQLVKDALKHIGKLPDAVVLPCMASPAPFHYRNKIQLPVGRENNRIVMGFYKRGSHDIVPYDRCHVHHPSMEETVQQLRALLQASTIEPYCEASKRGTLRHVTIRANAKGEQLLGLITTGRQKNEIVQLAHTIRHQVKNIVGVVESINRKTQNVILGEQATRLAGTPYLTEELDGLVFTISMESFFQVNLAAAHLLYQTALDYAAITKDQTVLDAYCGTGTMSLLAARRARYVIGAECVAQAVRDANENARRNAITNTRFIVGKVEEKIELFKNISCALVNPPRKGLDQRVISAIDAHGPKRVVYVSCNPATLARDIALLGHYQLITVQPVDMFPQTMHVESVALLERI